MNEIRNAYIVLGGKDQVINGDTVADGMMILKWMLRKSEVNIGTNWNEVAHDIIQWRLLIYMVMNIGVLLGHKLLDRLSDGQLLHNQEPASCSHLKSQCHSVGQSV
jgi:hypothetical protein